MPRNISFSLTTRQFRERTKTVTRRNGWKNLKPGTVLCGCEKCMGLKPGQKIVRLGLIRVLEATQEPLRALIDFPVYGRQEAILEGFPEMSGEDFARMYIRHQGGDLETKRTRIRYEYLDDNQ